MDVVSRASTKATTRRVVQKRKSNATVNERAYQNAAADDFEHYKQPDYQLKTQLTNFDFLLNKASY